MTRALLATCAAALLSACSLAPDYLRPEQPVPDVWPQSAAVKLDSAAPSDQPLLADIAWKSFFTDPNLQRLIETALSNNRDLKVAALNIEVARASYRVAGAALLPEIDAGASETMQHTPKALSTTVPQRGITTRRYSANLGITSFEIDLFGRLQSLEDQALETYLSTEEARDSTKIALVAEVANAYLTGRRQLSWPVHRQL